MSKINDFIQSVFKAASPSADDNANMTGSMPGQLKSNSLFDNQQAISALMTRLDDDKKTKPAPAADDKTRRPAYELSLILPPGKRAIPYTALEINVIKHIFKQQGISISNGAAEAIAERAKLDFTPKWDAAQKKYVANEKDGLYYRDSSFGKNSDMVLAGKQKNANGVEFNGYKMRISSDLQASILADKDSALDATKNGSKAFLEKTFNERFGMTIDKALAELPADLREKLKQIDAKTLLSAIMVGGVAVAALKKLPSEAVAVLAAGLTLKDVIQYGAEADHIADRIGKATKAGDLPVEELKTLITNGGLDILLAGVGFAGAKLAPKFTKLSKDALKLTDDAAREFGEAYRATKGKVADWANKVDDALSPGMVTPEGVVIKPAQIKGSNVYEARAEKILSSEKLKSTNLPAWEKLDVDMVHNLSGHSSNGDRFIQSNKASGNKDLFPDWMSDKQISDTIKTAYKNAKKIKTQKTFFGEIIHLVGEANGVKIKMYLDVKTNRLRAHPIK
jgi:hypothetical protein